MSYCICILGRAVWYFHFKIKTKIGNNSDKNVIFMLKRLWVVQTVDNYYSFHHMSFSLNLTDSEKMLDMFWFLSKLNKQYNDLLNFYFSPLFSVLSTKLFHIICHKFYLYIYDNFLNNSLITTAVYKLVESTLHSTISCNELSYVIVSQNFLSYKIGLLMSNTL